MYTKNVIFAEKKDMNVVLYIFFLFLIIGSAWLLIVLVHKANCTFGGEKGKSDGTTLGGCITFFIIICAILALWYIWDIFGGGYDYTGPFRR